MADKNKKDRFTKIKIKKPIVTLKSEAVRLIFPIGSRARTASTKLYRRKPEWASGLTRRIGFGSSAWTRTWPSGCEDK